MSTPALVVDWGGVLTGSLREATGVWLAADGIDPASFGTAMLGFLGDHEAEDNPLHALERGTLEVPDFEHALAARLRTTDGGPVAPEGLLTRMFAEFTHAPSMVELVRRVRGAGRRTALLSNSWGNDYPRDGWDELFDVVVISGEVGMRKPEARIYELTAQRLGVAASDCVFVDDLAANVHGAAAVGMAGVVHTTYDETVRELEVLLGLDLSA